VNALGRISLGLLLAGFVYSGVATARLYGNVFTQPAAKGATNAIDDYLAPVNLASADALRRAMKDAKSQVDDDVVLFAANSPLSRQDLYQVYYSTSYALYPQRVWLATCEAEVMKYRPRFVLVIGSQRPALGVAAASLSSNLNLVEIR
jgi:hypothetical protein